MELFDFSETEERKNTRGTCGVCSKTPRTIGIKENTLERDLHHLYFLGGLSSIP